MQLSCVWLLALFSPKSVSAERSSYRDAYLEELEITLLVDSQFMRWFCIFAVLKRVEANFAVHCGNQQFQQSNGFSAPVAPIINMIDKSKYASHGTFIKRLSQSCLARRDKPKLAIIQPFPTSKPRVAATNEQAIGMHVQSKTYSAKFRFQEDIDRKPVGQQFSQPFLYIEKVIKKQKVDQKIAAMKPEPFVTSKNVKTKAKTVKSEPLPSGFKSLFDFEQERKKIAARVFGKLLESEVHNLKDMFLLWQGKGRKNTPQLDVKQDEFVEFFKEIIPGRIAEKQVRHFFELYRNKAPAGKEKQQQYRLLSIKALSYNYQKWSKAQTEISNIMSDKALKERYISVKQMLVEFDKNYPALKEAMNRIKQYEESLKRHFRGLYDSYQNPYESEISKYQRELEKPIIKYDKFKKQQLTAKIEDLNTKNQQQHAQLTHDYQNFLTNYQESILPNHDLFFTKRTVDKLLRPLLNQYPYLTRQLIEQKIQEEQNKKERFLECLSDFLVELDKDKKHLAEDCFTLDEVVQMIIMDGKGKTKNQSKWDPEFKLYSMKKLIKEVKKQFLLRENLEVQSLDAFPSDQEISLEIIHRCFEMECTKVLFKNQIWTELLMMIPAQSEAKSKFHQRTIDSNLCLESIRRYFSKLDQRMKIELNKSKQISLMAENAGQNDFAAVASIIEGVANGLNDYVQDAEEQADRVAPLQIPAPKKVSFADVVDDTLTQSNFPDKYEEVQQQRQQQLIIRSLLKSIYEDPPVVSVPLQEARQNEADTSGQNFNSLAKSFFVPEGLNTNSFDIRYYEKIRANEEKSRIGEQAEVVRMGSSALLSHLPGVQQIKSDDPLRISRYLMTNIDSGVKEQAKVVMEKHFEGSIKEGVDHNYYRDKIRLQNKPTIYDSEGKSKYSVLMPVGYYQGFVSAQNAPDSQKWFLRAHHVQTLTEHPLSKKDNVIHTEYQSKLDKLPPKRRPDENVIEQNVRRKQGLIQSLEERISSLKRDLEGATRGSKGGGVTVPSGVVNRYYSQLTDGKQDKDLEIATYEGVLYDLRRKQKELLSSYRENESKIMGEPDEKWWERKDKEFNNELRKDRMLMADSLKPEGKHRAYVQKLTNHELY